MPHGAANASKLIALAEDPACTLSADAISILKVRFSALTQLEEEITKLDAEIAHRAKEEDVTRRLMTVPGIGSLIIGGNSVIIKRHVHASTRPGTWLCGMLSRMPLILVRVALANKMWRASFGPRWPTVAYPVSGRSCKSPLWVARASERKMARSSLALKS